MLFESIISTPLDEFSSCKAINAAGPGSAIATSVYVHRQHSKEKLTARHQFRTLVSPPVREAELWGSLVQLRLQDQLLTPPIRIHTNKQASTVTACQTPFTDRWNFQK
jgi:hypothetical protein